MLRRWRAYWIRRGKILWVPPPPPAAPPPYPPGNIGQPGWRPRWPRFQLRRGQTVEPPWPQVVAQPPSWPPEVAGQWPQRRLFMARRGRAATLVPDQPAPPPQRTRVQVRPALRRRGRLIEPPWPQATPPAAPSAVPQVIRPRVRVAFLRRGQLVEPPWVGAAPPTPPAFVPRLLGAHRPPSLPSRRGRLTWTPPPQGPPPLLVCSRRRVAPRPRPGQVVEPPWPQVVVQPSVWRPSPVRQAGWHPRWPTHQLRRGRLAEPVWPFVPPPLFVKATGTVTPSSAQGAVTPAAPAAGTAQAGGATGTVNVTRTTTGTTTVTNAEGEVSVQ